MGGSRISVYLKKKGKKQRIEKIKWMGMINLGITDETERDVKT